MKGHRAAKLSLAFVALLSLAWGAYQWHSFHPVYRATALLKIYRHESKLDGSHQSLFEELESPCFLFPIIEELNLTQVWAKQIESKWPTEPRALQRPGALALLQNALSFKPFKIAIKRQGQWVELLKNELTEDESAKISDGNVGYYAIIAVTAESDVPQEAAAIANAYVDQYKALEDSNQRAYSGFSSVRDQLAYQQKRVDTETGAAAHDPRLQNKLVGDQFLLKSLSDEDPQVGQIQILARAVAPPR